MARFVIEFRTKGGNTPNDMIPSLSAVDAETLPLAQREVEKTLQSGAADEAVIYQPVRVLRAARVVTATDMTGRSVGERAELLPIPDSPTPL